MLKRNTQRCAQVGELKPRLLQFLTICLLWGCSRSPELPADRKSFVPLVSIPSEDLFENITANSGMEFSHHADTNYFLPDQLGSGVALFDYNGDGRLDLYFLQDGAAGQSVTNQLFRQLQGGGFENISAGSGLDVKGRGMGVIAGDVNNDGLADLVVTEYGATRVFENLGAGKFRENTAESGVDNPSWAVPASFIDFDRDGWLDLAVGNYVDYDPTQVCHDRQGRQDFCAPHAFPPTQMRLWRNVTGTKGGAPKFEDWTVKSGIFKSAGAALGLICADLNGDTWPDIFCADDGRPNRLFVNQKDGTFTEEGARRGVAFNAMGSTAANMGVAFADFNGDALGDLFVTHLSEEFHSLFTQDKAGLFIDAIAESGMQQQAWRGTGFGTVAADFDLDGEVDIALVNGLVRRAVPGQTPVIAGMNAWWARYAQRPQLFLKRWKRFEDMSQRNPVFCGQAVVGRSLAVGDLDNDGGPDLVVGNIGGPAQIFRNVAKGRGNWLKVRLLEPEYGNRDAIGAEVRMRAGSRVWWNVLQPSMSYCASNDPTLHFGVGTTGMIESAEVLWANGEREMFEVGAVNRTVALRRGEGRKL